MLFSIWGYPGNGETSTLFHRAAEDAPQRGEHRLGSPGALCMTTGWGFIAWLRGSWRTSSHSKTDDKPSLTGTHPGHSVSYKGSEVFVSLKESWERRELYVSFLSSLKLPNLQILNEDHRNTHFKVYCECMGRTHPMVVNFDCQLDCI